MDPSVECGSGGSGKSEPTGLLRNTKGYLYTQLIDNSEQSDVDEFEATVSS